MAPEAATLDNCSSEPIHIPGSIQPHGCLIACDQTATTVLRHSANAAEMLSLSGPLNGRLLTDLLGPKAVHDIRNALNTSAVGGRPALMLAQALGEGRRFDIAVHRDEAGAILEFEPAAAAVEPLQPARALIGRISEIDDIDLLLERSSRILKAMLGYDRVMIYRFEADGSGKVVSESRAPALESFLGQYFPASDIPAQARILYLRNTIRIISDVDAERVPIVPELDDAGAPLDLSLAHLRSVSPIHCEYLRNMGVGASMSISVVVEGALWGLLACHHYQPRLLTMAERIAAELFGQFFSLHLHALKQRRSLRNAAEARQRLDRFLSRASHGAEVDALLRESLPDLGALLPCDGAGIWMNGRWTSVGTTPPAEAVAGLAQMIGEEAQGGVWSSHALSGVHPTATAWHAEASGVLAVPLSQAPRDWLLFFRREFVQTLDWGGNPNKSYATGPHGDRLTPRKSFAIWRETVERQARPWSQADRDIAEATRGAMVEVVLRHNEAMAEERARADVRQRMLNEELNHRVKNILAVIRSVVGHPVEPGLGLEEHVAALRGRIQALALAHDQVARGGAGGRFADLVTAELGPYRERGRLAIEGPEVWLDARAFPVMALVLHELATNAAKYGALSVPEGQLSVAWRETAGGGVTLEWRERGGPPVRPPSRTGFGSALLERSVPFDLGGSAEVEFGADGLVARFDLPARHLRVEAGGAEVVPLATKAPATAGSLPAGVTVLLVEDQFLIALDAEAMLQAAGAAQVVTVASLAEARARLRELTPDVAILDVNLGADSSLPLADELRGRGVPFAFATGYGDAGVPGRFDGVPLVRKPYEPAHLVAAVLTLLATEAGAGLRERRGGNGISLSHLQRERDM